ncbi:hypothetical protein ACO0E1_16065 [Curtobacterium sp. RRHDQ66]|uniref:hypothetical protein n=1 Tax=Curtobacterium guangdongense TaxID=3413380 RepID=UPI003BF180E4
MRGTRLPADRSEFVDVVMALGLVLRPDQQLSHVSAAQLWDCPLPRRWTASVRPIHVTTIGRGPVLRRDGVVGHRVAADRSATTTRYGIRTSTPAAFWYECRTLLSVRELVVLGDHIVGIGRLASVQHLRQTLHPGDRGAVAARAALEYIRPGSESPMESVVRLIVVDAGFPPPELNVDVRDESGRFIGRVDMAWVGLRIAIEYDGDHHRTDRNAFQRDRARGNDFTVEDWLTIHVTATDVGRPTRFLERLRRAFAIRHGGFQTP